jgi:cellobiose epimerase
MHVMEAYTVLFQCSKREIHRRKLKEVIDLIVNKMIEKPSGAGLNQFDLNFESILAIKIYRTWNADRDKGETVAVPLETTSYGHNVELAWLLARAAEVLLEHEKYDSVIKRLVDHALKYGVNHRNGGVYRDGPYDGNPIIRDKEWWQNSESLVGFLEAYERFGEEKYFEAFFKTWNFCREYFINQEVGEWRQLLNMKGNVIVGDIGNPWKAIYHTGRSMLECKLRLLRIISNY